MSCQSSAVGGRPGAAPLLPPAQPEEWQIRLEQGTLAWAERSQILEVSMKSTGSERPQGGWKRGGGLCQLWRLGGLQAPREKLQHRGEVG